MRHAILAAALCVAACGSNTQDGIDGTIDGTGGFATTATSGGGSGAAELTGDLAFTVEGTATERSVPGRLTVLLFDAPVDAICTSDTFVDELQVTVFFDGGAQLGSYVIDDGGAQVVLSRATTAVAPVAVAVSGMVTINRLDSTNSGSTSTTTASAGGNFLAQMQPIDGGATSQLSALFGAPYCD